MHHVTTADKTTLYLKDWGAGRPVILLSGWPLTADSWDDQAMVIAGSGYRVIAYDRRGFGRSSQPWGGYDYNTLADDLATSSSKPALRMPRWWASPWAAVRSHAICRAMVASP